jgi:hypothetical protein
LRQGFFENAARRKIGMDESQRPRQRDNSAMAVTAAIAKHDNVTSLRFIDFATAVEDKSKIAFFAPVQMPIRCIRTRIEWRAKTRIYKHTDDQHAAIDPGAVHVGRVMIGRTNPSPRFANDRRALVSLFAHGEQVQ